MSSSISSATSQQQFTQVQQNVAKTDVAKGNAVSNSNTQSAQVAQVQSTPTSIAKPAATGTSGATDIIQNQNSSVMVMVRSDLITLSWLPSIRQVCCE